jgi:hypothetical protein
VLSRLNDIGIKSFIYIFNNRINVVGSQALGLVTVTLVSSAKSILDLLFVIFGKSLILKKKKKVQVLILEGQMFCYTPTRKHIVIEILII